MLDQRLENMLKVLEDSPTREEFAAAFKEIVNYVKKVETEVASFGQALQMFAQRVERSQQTALGDLKTQVNDLFVQEQLRNIEQRISTQIDDALSSAEQRIDTAIASVKDGRDGRDGANGERGPKGEKGDKGEKGERGPKGDAGTVTDLRIQQAFKYILKTEQPNGDIDGVNTTYTVTQPIFAVLAFTLNGETIAQLPNYTIKGKTITFSTAIPSDYSGRDFEIKYI